MTKGERIYLLLLSALCTWLCWREQWAHVPYSAWWWFWWWVAIFTMRPFTQPPANWIIAWWHGRPRHNSQRYFELKKEEPR